VNTSTSIVSGDGSIGEQTWREKARRRADVARDPLQRNAIDRACSCALHTRACLLACSCSLHTRACCMQRLVTAPVQHHIQSGPSYILIHFAAHTHTHQIIVHFDINLQVPRMDNLTKFLQRHFGSISAQALHFVLSLKSRKHAAESSASYPEGWISCRGG
jgi:hypothetical protein